MSIIIWLAIIFICLYLLYFIKESLLEIDKVSQYLITMYLFVSFFISGAIKLILYNVRELKRWFHDFFCRTPKKTTAIYAKIYARYPSFMFLITLFIIWLNFIFDKTIVLSLIPILLVQLPVVFYEVKISNLDDLHEYKSFPNIHNGLNKNIIKREKAAIKFVSLISVIVSYIIIIVNDISKTSIGQSLYLIVLIFLSIGTLVLAISIFIFLRYTIYKDFIHKENAEIKLNKYKNIK